MLLSRSFVAYLSNELVKRLQTAEMVDTRVPESLTLRIQQSISEELAVEDRLNDEVRQILSQYADEMRRTGVSYQEMFKKVKGQLVRERKLILR